MHIRKAYDLIAVVEAVDKGRLTANEVNLIGWSKSRVIAAHIQDRDAAHEAVMFANKRTLAALVAYVRNGGRGGRLVTKSFHLTKATAAEVDNALARAGGWTERPSLEDRSKALMTIIRAYESMAASPSLHRKSRA